jgi:hypothetical protein
MPQASLTRDPEGEREEIARYLAGQNAEVEGPYYRESVGRVPTDPGRGWRERERRARSCGICEGDLWVETRDGQHLPCTCQQDRAERRAINRMRAGNWWQGTSLSFAAPPLAQVFPSLAIEVGQLCSAVGNKDCAQGLWLTGPSGSGKSAICAYFAQRLLPTGDAAVQHLGDLLAHLRWLGAVKGEAAVETKIENLISVPLLVIDDLDRPYRTFPASSSFAMRESCSSRDLLRITAVLSGRLAELRPTLVTSRANPAECSERIAAVRRQDLVRGLLATASGIGGPFEDFPSYTQGLLRGTFCELQDACRESSLAIDRRTATAA